MVLSAAAVATALTAALAPSAGAAGSPRPRPHVLTALTDTAMPALDDVNDDGCLAPSTVAVPDGEPIVASMAPYPDITWTVGSMTAEQFTAPQGPDPTWQMHLRAFTWVQPLAHRASDDGQSASLAALVDQTLAFYVAVPDAGTSVNGWDEGTSLRRLSTLNCLFALTGDPRIRTAMAAEVAVQTSPRYYGPPYHRAHNHGLMANLQMLRAARLTGTTLWRDIASHRISDEAPLVWSPRGITFEQSSAYQMANIDLWNEAARVVEELYPTSTVPAVIRARTQLAWRAYTWMTEPDGHIVQIGDSAKLDGGTYSRGVARALRDDTAGWVIGRWSWRDPLTTYYTLRYGPPRWTHGHEERGGVTFSTLGTRVLIGSGTYTYDRTTPFGAWVLTPQSHNVSFTDAVPSLRRWVTLASQSITARTDTWATTDTIWGRSHRRTVVVDGVAHSMRLVDTYSGTGIQRQILHLDPAWTLTSQRDQRLVFRHPSGRVLVVTTTGRVSGVLRGSTRPVQGWSFPSRGVAQSAYAIVLRSWTSTLDTTVRVA